MKFLFLSIVLASISVHATTYTRCKITHPDFEPDVFCLEDKGFHGKKYCAREAAKIIGIPRNSKVEREVVYWENNLDADDPYWDDCSSVHLDGRCWMFYGRPCI